MANQSNKIKAAIMGVFYYLQEQDSNQKKPANEWGRAGRESTMKNREWLQRRGKMIAMGRFR